MAEPAARPWDGYTLYKVFHKKEGRFYAQLVTKGHRTTRSFAKYLMEVKLGRHLVLGETVDHINNDKTDDRIENLQILSLSDNVRKSAKGKTMVTLTCPECGKEFTRERRQTHLSKGGRHTCCSRPCGGRQSRRARV